MTLQRISLGTGPILHAKTIWNMVIKIDVGSAMHRERRIARSDGHEENVWGKDAEWEWNLWSS